MKADFAGIESSAPIYPGMRDKVALVTGGSSGIGLATARAFARQGARVVIASRGDATARSALKSLAKDGDVQWQAADVANASAVARLIETVVSKHGRLDYAFNNGGSGGRSAPVGSMTEAAWRKTIDGYLTSVFICMSAEIPAMKRLGAGVIVNNASLDGLRGYPFPGGAAYSAAKHGCHWTDPQCRPGKRRGRAAHLRHLSRLGRNTSGGELDETGQGGGCWHPKTNAARSDRNSRRDRCCSPVAVL
jgi:NADP-dependent 3-hydroxy acid dehydrogenase YdfG